MSRLVEFDRALLRDYRNLTGVDEAGRGALAGPVVAGAVCLLPEFWQSSFFALCGQQFNDSKKLSPTLRQTLFDGIRSAAQEGVLHWSTGLAAVSEIAGHNILGATRIAMARALGGVLHWLEKRQQLLAEGAPMSEHSQNFNLILVDGLPLKPFPFAHRAITQGDGTSLAIAMASICAKCTRDRLMAELSLQYPVYGWDRNKGYGSRAHEAALVQHGPSPEHRTLFLRKLQAREQQILMSL